MSDASAAAWPTATQPAPGDRATDIVIVGGGSTCLAVRFHMMTSPGLLPPRAAAFVNGVLWMELHVVSHPRRGNEMVAFDSSRRLKPTAAELDLLRARCPLVKLGECNVLRIEIWGSSDRSAPNPHFDEAGSGGSGVGSGAAAAVANPHSAAPAANPHFDAKSTAAPTAAAAVGPTSTSASAATAAAATSARPAHFYIECNLYEWAPHDRVCVCDIDGTITRSDIRDGFRTILAGHRGSAPEGHLVAHDGVCAFLAELVRLISAAEECARGELRMLYLTARPISFAKATRVFLQHVRQDDGVSLPSGPLITNPGGVIEALKSELTGKAKENKAAALVEIQRLFHAAGAFDEEHARQSGWV